MAQGFAGFCITNPVRLDFSSLNPRALPCSVTSWAKRQTDASIPPGFKIRKASFININLSLEDNWSSNNFEDTMSKLLFLKGRQWRLPE